MNTLLDEILADLEDYNEIEREFEITPAEYIAWVKRSLNRLYGVGLVVDDSTTEPYREAIRRFQRGHGLPENGQVNEATQNAIIKANERDRAYMGWVHRALESDGIFTDPPRTSPGPGGSFKSDGLRLGIRSFQGRPKHKLAVDGFVGAKAETLLMRSCRCTPPGHVVVPPSPQPVKPPEKPKPPPSPMQLPKLDIPPHSYKSPEFKNSTKGSWAVDEKNRVKNAYPIAIDLVLEGKRIVDFIDSAQTAYQKKKRWDKSIAKRWFGEYSVVRLRRVRGFINTALKRLTTRRLIFIRRGIHPKVPTANAATGVATLRISIYDPFFLEIKDATYYCPGIGTATIRWKVFAGSVIVHEVMHQVRLTRSDVYGKKAEDLAKARPRYAVNNAENYQLFTAEAYINAVHSGLPSAWRKCWMDLFIKNYN